MTDFRSLISTLAAGHVEFIIVGGAAATAHGAARLTNDLDVVYQRSPENISRLVQTLSPLKPYLRGAPPGLPFNWDERTVHNGMTFTLTTEAGALDLLGDITGGGGYEDLLPHSVKLRLYGVECLCLGLERLIFVKRALGRAKDLEAIAELEALLEEQERG